MHLAPCGHCIQHANALAPVAGCPVHGTRKPVTPLPVPAAAKVPRASLPPAGGALVTPGAAVETARKEQKRAEARDSGRKLKPGRWRLNHETGQCEPAAAGEEVTDAQ